MAEHKMTISDHTDLTLLKAKGAIKEIVSIGSDLSTLVLDDGWEIQIPITVYKPRDLQEYFYLHHAAEELPTFRWWFATTERPYGWVELLT